MIQCQSLPTSSGPFFAHCYKAPGNNLLVFIPGLMEPKSGLFYIWRTLADLFHAGDINCLLFDLGGQGDSLLPLSIDVWKEQVNAILNHFHGYKIHFIARGVGALLLPPDRFNIAICPSLQKPLLTLLPQVRWEQSPFNANCLTPAFPNELSPAERECFHLLGAEEGCIGSLELPAAFIEELPRRLLKTLPTKTFLCKDNKTAITLALLNLLQAHVQTTT